MHRDFASGLESARKVGFPKSRPCDDHFHLRQKKSETKSHLSRLSVVSGSFQKTPLEWLRAVLGTLRLLPPIVGAFRMRVGADLSGFWRQHVRSVNMFPFGTVYGPLAGAIILYSTILARNLRPVLLGVLPWRSALSFSPVI